jgi:putative ABC transport system ATP-binding protein
MLDMSVGVALAAREVSKRVSDGRTRREILKSITLELCPGELVVIRGSSGSGKTTLLAVLGGMLLPTSGEVWIDGVAISRLRDHHRAEVRRRKIGYLFQDFALLDRASVIENVLLPLVPDGDSAQKGEERARRALERLGVGALAGVRAEALSGGERQRVALARALIHDPAVILLDEPTAHLDAERASTIVADLRRLAEGGSALLLASHDPRVCDSPGITRIVELRDGRLL